MKITKGVILAGGSGTRLYPTSCAVNKHLFPIFDKPMIFYPLSTLMLAGIRDILIVTNAGDVELFHLLLKDGSQWGIEIHYEIQGTPKGLAHALLAADRYLGQDPCALVLGDNIFHGHGLSGYLQKAMEETIGATLFGYRVHDPERYAVASLDKQGNLYGLEEKPQNPETNIAVTGLYYYDGTVMERAKSLKLSPRGEYEITDLNLLYLREGKLTLKIMDRGYTWFDAGTPESLLQVNAYVHSLDQRQVYKIACPEEVAYRQGFIDSAQFEALIHPLPESDYKDYLHSLLRYEIHFKKENVA